MTHRTSYQPMLERLVGDRPAGPVEVLADLCEPVKGYARGRFAKYTQATPLNAFVDALRPESEAARHVSEMVDRAIGGSRPDTERLRNLLTQWRNGAPTLQPVFESSYLLVGVAPLTESLAGAAASGLDALGYLEAQKKPDPAWLAKQLEALDRAKQPKAAVLLMIEPAVRKLVEAAAK